MIYPVPWLAPPDGPRYVCRECGEALGVCSCLKPLVTQDGTVIPPPKS